MSDQEDVVTEDLNIFKSDFFKLVLKACLSG